MTRVLLALAAVALVAGCANEEPTPTPDCSGAATVTIDVSLSGEQRITGCEWPETAGNYLSTGDEWPTVVTEFYYRYEADEPCNGIPVATVYVDDDHGRAIANVEVGCIAPTPTPVPLGAECDYGYAACLSDDATWGVSFATEPLDYAEFDVDGGLPVPRTLVHALAPQRLRPMVRAGLHGAHAHAGLCSHG